MYYYAKVEAKVTKKYTNEFGTAYMCECQGEHFGQDGFPVPETVKLFPVKNKTSIDVKEGDTVIIHIGDCYIKKDKENYTGVKHITSVKKDEEKEASIPWVRK